MFNYSLCTFPWFQICLCIRITIYYQKENLNIKMQAEKYLILTQIQLK